jgi:hypothetical protein
MKLTENKLREIIRESLNNIILEGLADGIYKIYYIPKGDGIFDGHFCEAINAKNDNDAIKIFLKQYFPRYKKYYAKEGDEEHYVIGVPDPDYEDSYDIIFDINFYTKNNKSGHYRYSYRRDGEYKFYDSFYEQNKKKYSAEITDWLGRTIQEIPTGYCGSMSMLKKYLHTYLTKQITNNSDKDYLYVRIYDYKTEKSKTYSAYINYNGELDMYEYDPMEILKN